MLQLKNNIYPILSELKYTIKFQSIFYYKTNNFFNILITLFSHISNKNQLLPVFLYYYENIYNLLNHQLSIKQG